MNVSIFHFHNENSFYQRFEVVHFPDLCLSNLKSVLSRESVRIFNCEQEHFIAVTGNRELSIDINVCYIHKGDSQL